MSETAPDAPRTAPPTTVTEVRQQPNWPTAIGVVNIVLGGFGVLWSVCGVVGMAMMLFFARFADPSTMPIYQSFATYGIPTAVVQVVSLFAAAWLIDLGIAVLRRRPRGVRQIRPWAILAMTLVVLSVALQVLQQVAQYQEMQAWVPPGAGAATPPPPPPGADMAFIAMMVVVGLIGLVVGWAYPVFLLVWFSRAKVRKHVATWESQAPAV